MKLKTLITIFMTMTLAISCSDVKFSNAPSSACSASDSCVVTIQGETLTKILDVPAVNNKVDLLFVVDNSRTMLDEQSKIASRLANFLDSLNGSDLDWRIAITTTDNDIAKRTDLYTPQDYREGQLVPFLTSSSGSSYATQNGQKIYYITPQTANYSSLFYNTVKRPESVWCSANQGECPSVISGDERGIYSALRNIQANTASFLRSDAQLHVIIISDEDERSNGGGFDKMALENGKDRPEDLLNTLRGLNKRTKVHSIVGLPSGFSYNNFNFESCVNSQIGNVSSQEYAGCNYLKASIDTNGIVGDKNTSNYTSILSAIADDIDDTSVSRFTFNCVPTEIILSSDSGHAYPSSLNDPQVVSSGGKNYIDFNPALTPGTRVKIKWTCPRT